MCLFIIQGAELATLYCKILKREKWTLSNGQILWEGNPVIYCVKCCSEGIFRVLLKGFMI